MSRWVWVSAVLIGIGATMVKESSAGDPKRIVILAGAKSHGPEGNGIHDYGWSARLIKVMLEHSNVRDDLEVEIVTDGLPTDLSLLDRADTIMIISDGRDGDLYEEALHLSSPAVIDRISRQVARGCGLVTFHFSTFAPDRYAEQILDWVGGYFDWETDGQRQWYSSIQTIEGSVDLPTPEHPVSRGVNPFRMKEEFYFNLRFPERAQGITPIASVSELPGRDDRGRIVAWARERRDGGRGFGTTCGHFYDNWKNDDFRRLVLNGLVWSAGIEPPAEGVTARSFDRDEITAALAGVRGAEPSVWDDRPLRVLLIAGNEAHRWHNWEKTTPILKSLLEIDPRIHVDVITEFGAVAGLPLDQYQAVVLNYCNWQDPRPPSQAAREAFELYMRRGGGLVVVHFANGAFHRSLPDAGASDWPGYRTIVRRVWDHQGTGESQSGHDPFGPFEVAITDVPHPITAGLESFSVTDELYFRQAGDEPIEPLLAARSGVTGKDEPLAFAYRVGDGRAFQTFLGHSERTYETFEAREILRRAVAWVADRPIIARTTRTDPNESLLPVAKEPLVPGRFGKALDARRVRAAADLTDSFARRPLTVDCWVRLGGKGGYNILIAYQPKTSADHWELFTEPNQGRLVLYAPGLTPNHVRTETDLADNAWHSIRMALEADRVRLWIDGRLEADERVTAGDLPTDAGRLAIGGLVEGTLGCDGWIDEVRIRTGIDESLGMPTEPVAVGDDTIALWRLDEVDDDGRTPDASPTSIPLHVGPPEVVTPVPAEEAPPEPAPHFREESVGFRWREQDGADDRWNHADIGPVMASVLPIPGYPLIGKGLSIRVGEHLDASVGYDTETCQWRAGWTGGFLTFDTRRHGLITCPTIAGTVHVSCAEARSPHAVQYRGLRRQAGRVLLESLVDGVRVVEQPWAETIDGLVFFLRSIEVDPSSDPIQIPVGIWPGVTLAGSTATIPGSASLTQIHHAGAGRLLVHEDALMIEVPPGESARRIDLALWSGTDSQTRVPWERIAWPAPFSEAPKVDRLEPVPTVVTEVSPGTPYGPFVVENLPLPATNPYQSLCFPSGHDFLSTGEIVVGMVHGDVWIARPGANTNQLVWRRFATGLHQPLGLKVIDDAIFVLGRDQITQLIDENGDGVADYYSNTFNKYPTSPDGHDFVTCLETDSNGQFCFLHADEGLIRVHQDRTRYDVLATGFRNPNGLGIGPGDVITVSPQEGTWTPSSSIIEVRPGGYYGYPGDPARSDVPKVVDRVLCWIPRLLDNSSGGQVWVPKDAFGPLGGGLLHCSYGQCQMLWVLREEIDGVHQGGVTPLPWKFRSGVMRGRFSPLDRHLYVTGLRGWVSAAVDDGCLCRIRYTGESFAFPQRLECLDNGIVIHFSAPVDRDICEDPDRYDVSAWNYIASENYGSPELDPTDPSRLGRARWSVESATCLEDGRSVFLEIPELIPVMQIAVDLDIVAADQQPIRTTIAYTIHRKGTDAMPKRLLSQRARTGQLPSDVEANLVAGVLADEPGQGPGRQQQLRQLAWHVPGIPSAGRITLSGFLHVDRRDQYRFRTSGTGRSRLFVDDQAISSDTGATSLGRGYHAIRLEHDADDSTVDSVRVHWSSDSFAEEPIPSTSLFHDRRNADPIEIDRQKGKQLVDRGRCLRCHEPNAADPLLSSLGPDLRGIGDRLSMSWIQSYLVGDPDSFRSMPALLDHQIETDQQTARDLSAYLGTLEGTTPAIDHHQQATEGTSAQGAVLYEDLGCIACHRLPSSTEEEPPRRPLSHVARKFLPGALEEFLMDPTAHHPATRMPSFRLSPVEARELAEFLIQEASPEDSSHPEEPAGDPNRGKAAYERLGCARCHDRDQHDDSVTSAKPFDRTTAWDQGCCRPNRSDREGVPWFGMNEMDRQSLRTWTEALDTDVPRLHAMNRGRELTEFLNCQACHPRDGERSPRGSLILEESERGLPPESWPDLTWAGEKLHPSWVRRLLAGTLDHPMRPWLKGRMPAFPHYATALAESLAMEHGLGNEEATMEPVDPSLARIGEQLTRLNEGLDCRQCHAVGTAAPLGDAQSQLALGINFVDVRDRLRREHYTRFVLDPPRFDITTRMPKLVLDGRSTKIESILDGDARKQFEAIWHFIQSLPAE